MTSFEILCAWSLAVFLLGVLVGALVWIPYTIRETNRRFEQRMEFARRLREKYDV